MDTPSEPLRFSTAIVRMAHVAGTHGVWIQFVDRSVYFCTPFSDLDWAALSKPQVSPGDYFNLILRIRTGFNAHPYAKWPETIGTHAFRIDYKISPEST